MTSYIYGLNLTDTEVIALEAAMEAYLAHCAGEIAGGAGAPYRAHAAALEAVRARLHDDSMLSSHRVPPSGQPG